MWICKDCGKEVYIEYIVIYHLDREGHDIGKPVGEDFRRLRCSECSNTTDNINSIQQIAKWRK